MSEVIHDPKEVVLGLATGAAMAPNSTKRFLKMQEEDECPICLQTCKLQTFVCSHRFCQKCVSKWFMHSKNNTCPTCRCSLMLPYDKVERAPRNVIYYILPLDKFEHAGITVDYCTTQEKLKITKIVDGDAGHMSGLCIGMIVHSINSVKCNSPQHCTQMLDDAASLRICVLIGIHAPSVNEGCLGFLNCRKTINII